MYIKEKRKKNRISFSKVIIHLAYSKMAQNDLEFHFTSLIFLYIIQSAYMMGIRLTFSFDNY